MHSTVLIIDQRKELSVKYKKSLDSLGANSIIAKNLKEAYKLVQELEPDMIIISDSIQESLAGFCQKIRALTYNTRPIIVALSKSAELEDRINVLESGADDFLSEPVSFDEFKMRIKAHLRRDVESNLDNKTLLPNEKYVKKALKRALTSENQAVLLIEIKNIEKYKIVYTELAADKIVQTLVAIAKSALGESDFIGQLDDYKFVVITNKYNAEKLAEFLTFAFDTVAPKFYSESDSTRGYMLLKGERYAGMRVNFVSILIGGIIDNFKFILSVDNLISKLYSVKQLANIPQGSNYVIDRVRLATSDSISYEEFSRSIFIKEADDSLNLLIRTSLELQGYDVLEGLEPNNLLVPAVMIIDSGDDLKNLESVCKYKQDANFANTKIIVTTTTHDKSKILDSGADLYLPKPYEISTLVSWVEYFLR